MVLVGLVIDLGFLGGADQIGRPDQQIGLAFGG